MFKKHVGKIGTYCIDEQREWLLQTCYARPNRLSKVAVSNKHPAIQGMPMIPEDEAKVITNTILEMKGARIKKQRKAVGEDNLMFFPRPLTYKGANTNWHREMAQHGDWTGFDISNFISNETQLPMKNIVCPVCLDSNKIDRLK